MHRYAQTNLQLYEQLGAARWTEPQLALLARGYELALEVCGTSFRPNGKPFVCHLVGTASILVAHGASRDEVVCGLVHSVYSHGTFKDHQIGVTDTKRTVVRGAVGADCETLVAEYTRLPWTATAVEELAAKLESLSAGQRSALRVRLANELEDHLDLGMRFSRKTKGPSSPQEHDSLLGIAEHVLGHEFSQELASEIVTNATSSVPDVLIRDDTVSFRSGAAGSS